MDEEIIFDYEVVMYIVRHISLVNSIQDLTDIEKVKMVVNFLEQNNLKTNEINKAE